MQDLTPKTTQTKITGLTMFEEYKDELVVDNFAGGGGASTGIEQGLGRPIDIAINHDPDAIDMHTVNHPNTRHYCESVWDVDPRVVTEGRPVGLVWLSPDCKHFSKAKGSKPVDKDVRGLAWLALRWAATKKPRIIMLENVEEFSTWGPLKKQVFTKRYDTGEIVKETVSVPDPAKKGNTFRSFTNALHRHGYEVQFNTLVASDYGAPTSRKRLFMIARCDGNPIVWPKPTHGDPSKPGFEESGLLPWKTAADIIDWSIPCPTIFERKKPLAENTMRRIYKGIEKFVINEKKPFILRIGQTGFNKDNSSFSISNPLTTITTKAEHCLVIPSIVKHFGGNYNGHGSDIEKPLPTITTVDHNALMTSYLVKLRGTSNVASVENPVPTITAGGLHIGEVRAFLIKYYGTNIGTSLNEPVQTITTKHRFGLVTVYGQQYQIADIGMRMLSPAELFAAQGFPKSYIIDTCSDGTKRPKYKQVARCGNSVPPSFSAALVRENYYSQALQNDNCG